MTFGMKNIELLDNSTILKGARFPYKVSQTIQVLVKKGELSCIVDFHAYTLKAPSMALFFPGQVIESLEASPDFDVIGIVLDSDFTKSLNLPIGFHEKMSFRATHFYALNKEGLEAFVSCYNMAQNIMKQEDHPYKEETLRHLFSAFYYGLGYYVHNVQSQKSVMTMQQELCERFITLVSEHFKEHREIAFYADRLCITKKYLSALLKQETGMTALEWIEKYVVLYVKSCLSSTSMTIQEISNELDFPSQSVFGKYFKRVEGISPKAYRLSLEKTI
ncbi:MAG: AraC family transcriptional regulator [Bacteroidales bacterium]|nr:AraC family transcriptional regulator [Bacteroidales bacterium]